MKQLNKTLQHEHFEIVTEELLERNNQCVGHGCVLAATLCVLVICGIGCFGPI